MWAAYSDAFDRTYNRETGDGAAVFATPSSLERSKRSVQR
jgi:hypothetical protein